MIHTRLRTLSIGAALVALLSGCGTEGPTEPGSTRFGQRGSVEVRLSSPLALDRGRLVQVFTWFSDGGWTLHEEVSYLGEVGDGQDRGSDFASSTLAGAYAQWVTQVNDNPGLSLFVDALDPALDPECSLAQSRITLTLRDETRGEEASWTRCASGFLGTLTPTGAGPDPAAARVVNSGTLARDFVLGDGFRSAYAGTQPFATLDEGESTRLPLSSPLVIQDQDSWESYWRSHRGPGVPVPAVDFESQTVVVAAVGERLEAGDSIEVRRILPVPVGTVVELVERIPGDFCSPVARRLHPFHIVVTPRIREPVTFIRPIPVERVPCG